MSVQPEVIEALQEKVRRLIDVAQQVRVENEEMKALVYRLQADVRQQTEERNALQESYQRLKMAKAISGDEEEIKAAKLRVTKIVREIDKCIALLNR